MWAYYSPAPFPKADVPAYEKAFTTLEKRGAIEWVPPCENSVPPTEGYYKVTDRGTAWVKQVLRIPIPKIAYLDEQGEVI